MVELDKALVGLEEGCSRKRSRDAAMERKSTIVERSPHCLVELSLENVYAKGKEDGKPIEDTPFEVDERKFVKESSRWRRPHPPLLDITPL